jgi:hypothetical protein
MPANDISDFLLKEYERISQAFFEARETTAKWVKYYLIIMAAPFSFFAFMYKDKPRDFDISLLPDTLSNLMWLIGFVGMFLAFIIIESSTDNILYARAVNGIRRIFMDRENEQFANIRQYVILPTDIKKPRYLGWKKTLWITIITGIINSCYISIGLSQTQFFKNKASCPIGWMLGILFFIIHLAFYIINSLRKEKKDG